MRAHGTPGLIERDRALAALDAAAAVVADRGAQLVLVTGEAGIGKSSLQLAFTSDLPQPWVVEHVDGYRTDRAYSAPFGQLTGGGDASQASPEALADAVRSRCVALAQGRHLALVVEDLHFLDPIAVRTLIPILDSLADHPVLVVATARPIAPDGDRAYEEALRELREHARTHELRLEPLSIEGVAAMLAGDATADGRDPRRTDEAASAVHGRTGGIPFFVEAVIGAGALEETAAVPWTVAATVSETLDDLGAGSRDVAELLAVQGGPLPTGLLHRTVPDGEGAIDLLERSGIVVVVDAVRGRAGSSVRLRHAFIADAVAESLDPVARVRGHRRLAAAMEPDGNERAADLARHLAAAGDVRGASGWAEIAADQLAVHGSYQRAVEMYELALTHPPSEPRRWATLLERASVAAAHAGMVAEAGAWGRAAHLARAADDRSWEAGRGWTNTFVLRALDDTRPDVADAADVSAERQLELDRIAELHAATQVALEIGDHAEARRLALEVDARATRAADALGRLNGALSLILCGEIDLAGAALDAVLAAADERGDLGLASVVWSRRTRLHNVVGDPGAATRCHERSHEIGRLAGGPDLWGNLLVMTAIMRSLVGELDGALELCDEAEGLEIPLLGDVARVARAAVAVERGDLATAAAHLDILVPLVRAIGIPYYSIPVLMLATRAALLRGELDDARSLLDEALASSIGLTYDFEHDLVVAGVVLAHLDGDRPRAQELRARIDHLAQWLGGPQLLAAVAFAEGLIARKGDDRAAAATAFARAAERWEEAPRWGFAADAWCAVAEVADGRVRTRALARAASIAAARGIPRVEWRVAVLTSDPGRRSPRPVSPDGLTAQELAVASSAATGRTNREIAEQLGLSEHTVRNYLSAAFAKLGIERRTQLPGALRE